MYQIVPFAEFGNNRDLYSLSSRDNLQDGYQDFFNEIEAIP